mgnify:CR=1 FL=1
MTDLETDRVDNRTRRVGIVADPSEIADRLIGLRCCTAAALLDNGLLIVAVAAVGMFFFYFEST